MIYIVIGSEDGYLRTFQSKKKAVAYSALYVTGFEFTIEEALAEVEVAGGKWEFSVTGPNANTQIFVDNFDTTDWTEWTGPK